MELKIIPRSSDILPVNHNVTAVNYIECVSYNGQYRQYGKDEITPDLISKILNDVPKGIEASLCLDPDGEEYYGCLEVVSDGKWLSL